MYTRYFLISNILLSISYSKQDMSKYDIHQKIRKHDRWYLKLASDFHSHHRLACIPLSKAGAYGRRVLTLQMRYVSLHLRVRNDIFLSRSRILHLVKTPVYVLRNRLFSLRSVDAIVSAAIFFFFLLKRCKR